MARANLVPVASFTEFGQSVTIADWLSTPYLNTISLSDATEFTLPAKFVPFPELLSQYLYGTSDYWWVLCMVNGVIDPIGDMNVGENWVIPSLKSINDVTSKFVSQQGQQVMV